MIAVAGCVAQAEGQEILKRASVVDLVVGPQSYHELPSLIGRVRDGGERVVATEFQQRTGSSRSPNGGSHARSLQPSSPCRKAATSSAHFASCRIARREYSRPVAAILAEAARLARSNVREIMLLGQNVNAYRGLGPDRRDWSLAKLLKRLAAIPRSSGSATPRAIRATWTMLSSRCTAMSRSSCPICICRFRPAPTASSPP